MQERIGRQTLVWNNDLVFGALDCEARFYSPWKHLSFLFTGVSRIIIVHRFIVINKIQRFWPRNSLLLVPAVIQCASVITRTFTFTMSTFHMKPHLTKTAIYPIHKITFTVVNFKTHTAQKVVSAFKRCNTAVFLVWLYNPSIIVFFSW